MADCVEKEMIVDEREAEVNWEDAMANQILSMTMETDEEKDVDNKASSPSLNRDHQAQSLQKVIKANKKQELRHLPSEVELNGVFEDSLRSESSMGMRRNSARDGDIGRDLSPVSGGNGVTPSDHSCLSPTVYTGNRRISMPNDYGKSVLPGQQRTESFTNIFLGEVGESSTESDNVLVFYISSDKAISQTSEEHRDKVSVLCELIRNGKTDDIKQFVSDYGGDLQQISNAVDSNGQTAITLAANAGLSDILQLLFDAGVSLASPDKSGHAAIHCAVLSDQLETVQYLASLEGHTQLINGQGQTPLHLAAKTGNLSIATALLAHSPDLDTFDLAGQAAIHVAAKEGHAGVVQLLLAHGAIVNLYNHDGNTALHIAIQALHTDVVKVLVKNAANVNLLDNQANTCLILAIQCGNSESAKILLENGAHADLPNRHRCSSLHLAVQYGSTELVNLLLDHGASVNVQNTDRDTPLDLAIQMKKRSMVSLLLDKSNTDPTLKNKLGWISLHRAAYIADCDTIEVLLDHTAVDVNAVTDKGETSMVLACAAGSRDAVRLLLSRGGNVTLSDRHGWSPLHAAANANAIKVADLLIHNGADVNAFNYKHCTPLYVAARRGHSSILAVLLASGADVTIARQRGWTPLHIASQYGHSVVADQLLAAGADPNLVDEQGQSSLAIAAYNRHTDIVRDMAGKCKDAASLFKIAKLANKQLLQYLKFFKISLDVQNMFGWSPLHYATKEGNTQAALLLIEVGADVNIQDHDGNTPLHFASLHGHLNIAKSLTAVHAYVNLVNRKGDRPLTLAVQNGQEDIVQLLLRNGTFVNGRNSKGQTPLFGAIERGHTKIVKLLLDGGADTTIKASNGQLPVQAAAELGQTEALHLLLERGSPYRQNLLIKDNIDNNLLHMAANKGHLDTVLELIINGIDVNLCNGLQKKAIHLAAENGHIGVVEALLDAGSVITLVNEDGSIVYELAKHKAVWDLLRQWASANPGIVSSQQRTLRSGRPSSSASSTLV